MQDCPSVEGFEVAVLRRPDGVFAFRFEGGWLVRKNDPQPYVWTSDGDWAPMRGAGLSRTRSAKVDYQQAIALLRTIGPQE